MAKTENSIPAPAGSPAMGPLQRIVGVLIRPGETFRDVVAYPVYKTALLMLIGVNVFFTALVVPKFIKHMHWSVEFGPLAQELDAAQIKAFYEMHPAVLAAQPLIMAIVGPLALCLLYAVLLRVYGNFTGMRVTIGALFGVAVFGFVPHVLGLIIDSILRLAVDIQQLQAATFSLARLVPDLAPGGARFSLLDRINPFTVWAILLTAYGGAQALKESFWKIAVFLGGLWFLFTFFGALTAVMPAK